MRSCVKVGARSSPLSRAQVKEVYELMGQQFETRFFHSRGDLDRTTSLRDLDKTDFFTREIDRALLDGEIDAAIHSAKDLPEPLPEGLMIAALTEGQDSRDALVLHKSLEEIQLVGTSSKRREEQVSQLKEGLTFIDLRGTIEERLARLESDLDAVVIAEAALVRLGLTKLNRLYLPGETTPLQGQLAIVIREGDQEMLELFSQIDAENLTCRA